jgi:small subunit ribosomal protein S17
MTDTTHTTTGTATTAPAAAAAPAARAHRKARMGEVISNKMAKTIVVRVERRFPHRKFKKVITG